MDSENDNLDDMDDLDATQITLESIVAAITELGDDPSTPAVQKILNDIAAVEDDTDRLLMFTEAIRLLKGALKDMAKKVQSQASKDWKEHRKRNSYARSGAKPNPGNSEIPRPFWGRSFGDYNGRTFVYGPKADGDEFDVPLHSPLRFSSFATFPDRKVQVGKEVQGTVIEFEDRKGDMSSLVYQQSDALSSTYKEGMIQDLANAGVDFGKFGAARVQEMMLCPGNLPNNTVVYDYPGWRGETFYVAAGGEVIGETNLNIKLSKPLAGIAKKGTPEAWTQSIAHAFCPEVVHKAIHVPATVLFGFSSPLVDRADEEISLFLALSGKTTQLKTFSLRLMASVWGVTLPKRGDGVLLTFNTTNNRAEQNAARRSGCGMALDDTTLTSGEKLRDNVYRLAGGQMRGRFGEDDALTWNLGIAISSEIPIQQFLSNENCEPPPGLMSRVVEIIIDGERVSDDPVNGMRGAFENYGHAGPVFIKAMLDGGWDREKIRASIKEKLGVLLGGTGKHEQGRRAARGVAFIWLSGEIAQAAELIPADFDVASFAAALWKKVEEGADTETHEVEAVKHAVADGLRTGDITIYSGDEMLAARGDRLSGVVCQMTFTKDRIPVFVFTGPALSRIIGGRISLKDALKTFDARGMLVREQTDRYNWKAGRTGVGDVSSYVMSARAVLGADADDMIQRHWDAGKGGGNIRRLITKIKMDKLGKVGGP